MNQLNAIIDSAVTAMDCELVGCELQQQNGKQLLRVYVDREGGINIDTITQVSRQISAVLDVEDPMKGRYLLEVSSPGLDRPLFTAAHYRQFIGRLVKVRLRMMRDGRRQFQGVIMAVADETITLQTEEGESLDLAFNDIDKGHLVPEF